MKFTAIVLSAVVLAVPAGASGQVRQTPGDEQDMRVILLGTQGGPTFSAQRLGIGTLVLAGSERLLFDAGRDVTTGMVRVGVVPADVTKVFLTQSPLRPRYFAAGTPNISVDPGTPGAPEHDRWADEDRRVKERDDRRATDCLRRGRGRASSSEDPPARAQRFWGEAPLL